MNTRCGQSSEGIFPLPLPSDIGLSGYHIPYLEAMIRGLNLLAGSRSRSKGNPKKVGRELVHQLEGVLIECDLIKREMGSPSLQGILPHQNPRLFWRRDQGRPAVHLADGGGCPSPRCREFDVDGLLRTRDPRVCGQL